MAKRAKKPVSPPAVRSRGRPPLEAGKKDRTIRVRVDDATQAAWEAKAANCGLKLSEWLRQLADEAK